MTTVINTPPNTNNNEGGSGWFVAIIILLVVIGAGVYIWYHYGTSQAPAGTTNINVTLPQNPVKNPTPAQ